jgi:hypothetical protein
MSASRRYVFSTTSADLPIPGHGREDQLSAWDSRAPDASFWTSMPTQSAGCSRHRLAAPSIRELAVPGRVDLCLLPDRALSDPLLLRRPAKLKDK